MIAPSPLTVYVLSYAYGGDPETVVGVYSSRLHAENAADAYNDDHMTLWIRTYVLDQNS